MISHLPHDISEKLELPIYLDLLLKFLLKIVKWFHLFRYPLEHDPDKETITRGVYGVWKAKHPIIKSKKGSGLKQFFRNQKFKEKNLLPPAFMEEESLTLSAVGDLMKNPVTKYSKNKFYNNVADLIFNSEIAVANLESALTNKPIEPTKYDHKGSPKINASLEEYKALIQHEDRYYDLICMCNNHTLDCGEEGFFTTVEQIKNDGIEYFGINLSPEDVDKALIFEEKGIKFGFIGFTYSLNKRKFPAGKEYLVNMVPFHKEDFDGNLNPIKNQINYCKQEDCDLIILTLHWGLEYEFYPTPQQVEIAHELVEAGADLIISHHTHCIQPFELYKTKRDADRIVPILYGLGNLSANKNAAYVVLSLIAQLEIVQGTIKSEKKTFIKQLDLTPVFQLEKETEEGYFMELEKLAEMTDKEYADPELADYISTIKKYAELILEDECKASNNNNE